MFRGRLRWLRERCVLVRGRWQETLSVLEGNPPMITVALQVLLPPPHVRQHGSQLGDLVFKQPGDALRCCVLERCRLRWRTGTADQELNFLAVRTLEIANPLHAAIQRLGNAVRKEKGGALCAPRGLAT
jgi:hypothetical protein